MSSNQENSKKKKMKKGPKKTKGFSLVELLAVIVIIGVISVLTIGGVSRYISRSRNEKISQSKKNVAMSAQMYLQANRDLLPKMIGDATIIRLSVLREKNYIKEDVTNADGETCMENSFVRVYMLDDNEYSYTTYLYCGNDEVPDEPDVPEPVVLSFDFTAGGKKNTKMSDVKDAKFTFKLKGAEDDDTVGIYSYSYSIFIRAKEDQPYTEVFNSGTLKGGLEPTISVTSQTLSSYMSLTGYNNVRVDITAVNEQGGKLNYTKATGEFQDSDDPICGEIEGQAADDNDWINKETYGADGTIPEGKKRAYPGRISVNCSDGMGSGCKRDKFTRSWPNNSDAVSEINNYKLGARWSYVLLEDNAEKVNSTKCYVRANVDVQAPEVTVHVFNGKTKAEIKTITVKDSATITAAMPEGTITSTEYAGVTGTGTEKWLNFDTIGTDGIYINVDIKDNLYLYSYEWKVNNPYVAGGTSDNVIASTASTGNVAGEGGTKATDYFESAGMTDNPTNDEELKTAEHGALSGTITNLKIVREGKRYGQLKVCDKAGNCTTVKLYVNIDVTPPLVPDTSYEKITSRTNYDPGNVDNYKDHYHWSNEYVRPYVDGQRNDKETQNASVKVELSGWDQFVYSYRKQTGKTGNTYNWATAVIRSISSATNGRYGFDITDEGTHIVTFKSCDRAENCSEFSVDDYVKVDTIQPTCEIVTKYEENGTEITKTKIKGETTTAIGSTNGSGWLKIGQQVTLSHSCADENSQLSSGCNGDDYHNKQKYLFNSDIDTAAAGANGYNTTYGANDNTVGGHVVDYAGNVSEECPKMTVKVDHTAPTCATNITWPQGEPLHPTTAGKPETGWLGLVNGTGPGKKTANIAKVCNDPVSTSGLMTGVHSTCDNNGDYDSTKMNQKNHTYDTEMWITTGGAEGNNAGGMVIDKAGNTTPCPTDRTVKIDYTVPVCNTKIDYGTGSGAGAYTKSNADPRSANGWLGWVYNTDTTKKMARVTQVCTDPNGSQKSGCYGDMLYKVYDYEMNVTNAGAVKVGDNGDVYDTAGNKTNCNSATMYTVKIDYTRPICEVSVSSTGSAPVSGGITRNWAKGTYNGEWVGVGATVTINSTCTAAESGTGNSSGCKNPNVKRNYTAEINTAQATSSGDNVAHYVYDKADNRAANECPRKTVKIDLSGPTCTTESRYAAGTAGDNSAYYDGNSTGYNGWINGSHSVRVRSQCTADKLRNGLDGSGCNETAVHGNNYTAASGTILNAYRGAQTNGNPYIIYDKVGNPTTCGTKLVKIDNQKPVCTVTSTSNGAAYNGAWTNQPVTVSRACNDGSGSGCTADSLAAKSNTYTTSSYESFNNGGAVSKGNSGTIKDNVGNETTCATDKKVQLDVTKPTCTVSISGKTEEWTNGNVIFQGNCSDTGSGCKTPASSLTKTFSTNTNATYEYSMPISDNAGNTNTCKGDRTYTILVQKTKPSCSLTKYSPESGQNLPSEKGVNISIKCQVGSNAYAPITFCGDIMGSNRGANSYTMTETVRSSSTSTGGVTYYVEDKAGNRVGCSTTVYSKYQNRSSSSVTCSRCSSATCQTYNSCQNSNCTCQTYKRCKSAGCSSYKWSCAQGSCFQDANQYSSCSTNSSCSRVCETYKRGSVCGCETRNSCRDSSCGCETRNQNCSKCNSIPYVGGNWYDGSNIGWSTTSNSSSATYWERRTVYY